MAHGDAVNTIPPADQTVLIQPGSLLLFRSAYLERLAIDALKAYIAGKMVQPDTVTHVATSVEENPRAVGATVLYRYQFRLVTELGSGTEAEAVCVQCACQPSVTGAINDTSYVTPLLVLVWDEAKRAWQDVITHVHAPAPPVPMLEWDDPLT